MIKKVYFLYLILTGIGYCDYFPLKTGNSWYYTYVDSGGGTTGGTPFTISHGYARFYIDSSNFSNSVSEYFFTDSTVITEKSSYGVSNIIPENKITRFTIKVMGDTITGGFNYFFRLLNNPFPIKKETSPPLLWFDDGDCDFSLNDQKVSCIVRRTYQQSFAMADNVGIIWANNGGPCPVQCMGNRGFWTSYSLISFRLNGIEVNPIISPQRTFWSQSKIRVQSNGIYFGPQNQSLKLKIYTVIGKLIVSIDLNKGSEFIPVNWQQYSEKILIFSIGKTNSIIINPSY